MKGVLPVRYTRLSRGTLDAIEKWLRETSDARMIVLEALPTGRLQRQLMEIVNRYGVELLIAGRPRVAPA